MSVPSAFGAPVLAARIRVAPEDFRVEELPAFEPSGSGEHLLLEVEKRGLNTAFVAARLARWAGIPEAGVGHAGLKDRHAVTRQRFSLHLPKKQAPDLDALQVEGLRVLEVAWHGRKLQRGALAGNRFELVLREVAGDRAAIEERLARIATRGVPNAFGEQRFGHGGGNVGKALAMFAQEGRGRRMGRNQRAMLLSAARSALFNRVLAARVADGSWDRGLEGEVWMLAGSRSVFGPEPWGEALAARLATFDIHPSGPLWGRGELRSQGACRALELAALVEAHGPTPMCEDMMPCFMEEYVVTIPTGEKITVHEWVDYTENGKFDLGDERMVVSFDDFRGLTGGAQLLYRPKHGMWSTTLTGRYDDDSYMGGLLVDGTTTLTYHSIVFTWELENDRLRIGDWTDGYGEDGPISTQSFNRFRDGERTALLDAFLTIETNASDMDAIDVTMQWQPANWIEETPVSTLESIETLDFGIVNGALILEAGSFQYTFTPLEGVVVTARITVDADPAYLAWELDEDGDGTFELSGRIAQSDFRFILP